MPQEPQGQVLGVTDVTIETPVGDAPLEDFSKIDLEGANGEGDQAHEEEHRSGYPYAL